MHVSKVPDGDDTIRILITTDNHVGYNENDPVRSDDSWKTFQEITYLAKTTNVDMILQSGDLFHVNKPSKKSMYHVMRSLRLNCMGDRPCELELLSDPSLVLSDGFNVVNYEDPNLNISIPVFAISGNHDDATGEGLLSPIDLLSVAGLVNHFGKVVDNDSITVSPLLFQKGSTKLSLYGLANVRDERLFKTFRDGKVKFLRPNVATEDWFNLICVHQNHSAHTNTSYLPELFLPNFLDLIVWGHEHECIPHPVHNSEMGFETLQPGSSVATSLCEGEAVEKNVFILNVRGKDYSIEPIPLKTVRPFVMEEVSLKAEGFIPGPSSKEDIVKYLADKVEELIDIANEKFRLANPDLFEDEDEDDDENENKKEGEDKEEDSSADVVETNSKKIIPLPLIRLRVDYSGGYEVGNPRRFSNRFVGKVANVNDVVQFYKKKNEQNSKSNKLLKDAGAERARFTDEEVDPNSEKHVQELMNEFLRQTQLTLLPEDGMNNAVATFLNQDDKHILKKYIDTEMKQETQYLLDVDIDYDEFHGKNEMKANEVLKSVLTQIKREKINEMLWDSLDPISIGAAKSKKSTPTPPPQRRITAPKSRAKSKEMVSDNEDEDDDVDGDEEVMILDNDDDDEDENVIILSESEEDEIIPRIKAKAPAKPRAPPKPRAASKPKASTKARAAPKPRAKKVVESTNGKRSALDDLMNI